MKDNVATNKSNRINLSLPLNLSQRANQIARELNLKLGELIRKALKHYLDQIEKEKLEQEIIEACHFYNSIDKEIADEWREAEAKI